jgi:hypothetical protein
MSQADPGQEFLARPYAERQRIVVADDVVIAAEREAEQQAVETGKGVDWGQVAVQAASLASVVGVRGITGIALGVGAVGVGVEAVSAAAKAREEGLKVLAVSRTEAAQLRMPPGHPRDRVVYVGHPALAPVYYPAAGFHRFTFEHKFSEAVRLLMALAATELEVEHVRGWSEDFAANLSAPLPTTVRLDAEVTAGRRHATGSSALFRAKLAGLTEPRLPDDLVWFPYEPTWQQVADGRLHYGLQEFQLTVRYDDDYGIDAGFKLSAQKLGLDLGGTFQEHESTTWKITGTFKA